MFDAISRYPFEATLILLLAVLIVWLIGLAVVKVLEIYRVAPWGPRRVLINQIGRVVMPISTGSAGKIAVYGEIWDAVCDELADGETLEKDSEVQVRGFDSLDPRRLQVSRRIAPAPPIKDID